MISFLVGVFTGICFVLVAQALLWAAPPPLEKHAEAAAASDAREAVGATIPQQRLRLVETPENSSTYSPAEITCEPTLRRP